MNTGGKVATGLVLLFAALAIWFTTKLLAVRNTWLTRLEDKQKQLVQSKEDLVKARVSFSTAEQEVQTLAHLWGEVWPAPNSQPIGQGAIQIGTGGAAGLGAREKAQGAELPVVYVFHMNEQGDTKFQGEFKLVDVQPDTCDARTTFPLVPGEQLEQGFYRVRNNVPAHWRARLDELHALQVVADDQLRSQVLQLETVNGQNASSRQVLDLRLEELNGDPTPPPGASRQVTDGLVQTLRNIEQERNQVLGEVDRLRKTLDSKYVELRKTLQANEELRNQQARSYAPVDKASLEVIVR